MDYKVASLLALMFTSVLSVPYQHPAAIDTVEHGAPKCPCAKIYFPLCASDGKNYNNMCEFNCQARHVRKLYGIDIFVIKETRCEEIE